MANMKFLKFYLCALVVCGSMLYADGDATSSSQNGASSNCAPACCQTLCNNSTSIQNIITANDLLNVEVHSVCCFCLIIGEKSTSRNVKRLWYVNQCGVLDELATVPNCTSISVTGLKACNVCFIKATLTDGENVTVKVWRVEPDSSLSELSWYGVSGLADFNVSSVKECGVCFIKATVVPQNGSFFTLLWLVDNDGTLIDLLNGDHAAVSVSVLGIKVCNICFVRAVANHTGETPPTAILWRVEHDGTLTRLIGPDTGINAYSIDLKGIKECNNCFVRAELVNASGCSSVLWVVEADGSLTEKRFLNQNPT